VLAEACCVAGWQWVSGPQGTGQLHPRSHPAEIRSKSLAVRRLCSDVAMDGGGAEGTVAPGCGRPGSPHQNIFMTNDHKTAHDDVC